MTYIALGLMMFVLVAGTMAAAGYATIRAGRPLSDSLITTGCATGIAWIVGGAVVVSAVDVSGGAGARVAFTPGLVPLFLFVAGGIHAVAETVSETSHLRRQGYSVKLWLPRWAVITGWLAATVAIPYGSVVASSALMDGAGLTDAESSTGADAVAMTAMIEVVTLMIVGAIYVWGVRERRMSRNLAPVPAGLRSRRR